MCVSPRRKCCAWLAWRSREQTKRRGRRPPRPWRPSTRPPPHPDLADILADWRAGERRLEAAEPASAEADSLMREFEVLRDRYTAALRAVAQGSYPRSSRR